MRLFLLLLLHSTTALQYVSHVFKFPLIAYYTGVYHIHSPSYFIEAHGFAMPGFTIHNVQKPRLIGDYVTSEFNYTTYFDKGIGRVFTEHKNISRVLLQDEKGVPIVSGMLSVENSKGKVIIRAHGDLLRLPTAMEEMMKAKVIQKDLERVILSGYTNYKSDMNLKLYLNMVMRLDPTRPFDKLST